jgi:hypothetical protein
MVQGPNDLPEIVKAAPAQAAQPSRAKAVTPAAAKPFQAEDSVQISPQAAQASQLLAQVKSLPDVRDDRVQDVRSKLSAAVKDSASLNAKLAEKLLTEN